jgi:6-phosphogluconolactonase
MSDPRVVVKEGVELHRAAAAFIANAIAAAVKARGKCTIALSGGNTPQPVYALLAQAPLSAQVDWAAVHVYFADERAVPPDHADSNYRAAHETLLSRVPIPPSQVHRMEAERADLDAAAHAYEHLLPRPLDVLVLGAGPDGHTASIFPDSGALLATGPLVTAVLDSPKPPPRRLTITPPVIEDAREIVVIATGAGKARVIAGALKGPEHSLDLPIELARRGAWFLDQAAASLLA